MKSYKVIAIIKAVLSSLVWGLGQAFNRQFLKGLMFFSVFLIIISAEFFSGNYGSEFNLFEDKIPGEEVKEEVAEGLIANYYYNLLTVTNGAAGTEGYEDFTFLQYVAEVNGLTFDIPTQEELDDGDPSNNRPFFTDGIREIQPENVSLTGIQLTEFIAEQLLLVEEAAAAGGTGDINELAAEMAEVVIESKTIDKIIEYAERDARAKVDYQETLDAQIETLAIEDLVATGHVVGEVDWDATVEAYINSPSNYEDLVLEAEDIIFAAEYDVTYDTFYETTYQEIWLRQNVNNKEKFYNQLYGEFAVENESILAFKNYLYAKYEANQLNMDNDDANKMLVRIYYLTRVDDYNALIERVDNPFYERGGYFSKGIWGAITLGEVPLISITEHESLGFLLPDLGLRKLEYSEIVINGHHSTKLLLNGIIALMALFYLSIIYVWNIRDAYKTSIKTYETKQRQNERQYYKEMYENFFEYIVLSPALLLVSFISLMPIIFGILIAFTNYGGDVAPPGNIIEWVGFKNFFSILNISGSSGSNFGVVFWKVFSWTLIWAFAATFTCFFGGFVQAVIISNKRVVFRKAWRSILILPWAVPALISQMIFRVMFQDLGYVNQTLARMGVVEWFTNMGFIGKTYSEAINAGPVERFFHMGTTTFEWLSNEANPWFVRIFIIILNIWLGFPFFMALMSGVMTSIDKSLYEAASIDGATGFQQFRFITMPLVLYATSPLLVMTFSGNFNNFGVIYFITGGGPGEINFDTAFAGQTDILISWIYRLTTDAQVSMYNMASVFSILIFLMIGSVSAWNFTRTRAFREGD